jgi:hypothetical protein
MAKGEKKKKKKTRVQNINLTSFHRPQKGIFTRLAD